MSYEITNNDLASILRAQAWARAKGELGAVIMTYYGQDPRFEQMDNLIVEFIKTVESEGLAE